MTLTLVNMDAWTLVPEAAPGGTVYGVGIDGILVVVVLHVVVNTRFHAVRARSFKRFFLLSFHLCTQDVVGVGIWLLNFPVTAMNELKEDFGVE